MNNKILILLLACWVIFGSPKTYAATDSLPSLKTYKVGIFAPLYLDSIFSAAGNFRYRQGMPKFMVSANDFVNGALIALDSLKITDANIEATVFDTKSYSTPLADLVKNKKLDGFDLLIGSVKEAEYKQLADLALLKNIPFISATYPNDGGITNNPFVVVVNSTLKAHCEAIFSYILQGHGSDKIYLIRKKGTQEDKVASYFKMINEQDGKPLLNIQTILIDSTIEPGVLSQKLDSTKQCIIIGGSLEESFATDLTKACNNLRKEYKIMLFGMPNWDAFKALSRTDNFENFPIYFTTPYFNTKEDSYSKILLDGYTKKLKSKPTDMAFKGFECTYLFTKLLAKYPTDLINHLNEKSFKIISEYNFKPVSFKKSAAIPDYFENKHLYFIKLQNGTISKAW